MISLWQYEGFRHIFRIITAVWGVGFLLEAALRVAIVYNTSTGTALSLSNERRRSAAGHHHDNRRPGMIPKMPGVALLTGRWRTLQHITASPSKIGDIARATLVLTHFEHGYIT